MAGSIQLIYLIIKKILNIINWLNLNFCNSYLLKFPLKKEENSMKETNIIYDSVSNTWSIIVKMVNKSLLQIEYPELTGYKTKEDAEIAYHKTMHQFAMDMENIKSITGVKYTLSSYIEHWYVDIFKQYTTSPSYLQTTDWAIQRVILPSIEEDHLLINLTPEYINDILQRCAKLPYRTAGIVSRKILCTILKTAEAEELLDIKFSFESIITFPRIPPKYIAYEKEDICKLLEIAKKSDAIYLEILLCLFAGLRIGEVRGLNYDHVDFQNNTITIMQQIPNESYIEIKTENGIERRVNENCIKPPKSGASYRTLKVSDIIMEELRRRKELNAYYFQTHPEAVQYWKNYVCIGLNGELISNKTVTLGLYKLCKKNGLPKISAHGLRHICATILLEQGVPLEEISHILGHASSSTTFDIYCGEIRGRNNIIDFLSKNLDPIESVKYWTC